jgi:glycosyltransferase involved in cell wall biosynthesis
VQGFCKAFKPSDPVVLWILARPFLESGTVSSRMLAPGISVPWVCLLACARRVVALIWSCCSRPLSVTRPQPQDFDAKVRKYAAQLHGIPESEVEARLPRIYTSSQHLSEADFISVYSAVDALVLPTHAEGWGRPQMEAMSMALPVITTNWCERALAAGGMVVMMRACPA